MGDPNPAGSIQQHLLNGGLTDYSPELGSPFPAVGGPMGKLHLIRVDDRET